MSLALLGWTQAVQASPPQKLVLDEGADHYYRFGEWEDGQWLWLRRDGSYVEVRHDDQQVVTTKDRGRWRFADGRLILDTELRVRDIETPEFTVQIQNDCGVSLLPRTREVLIALQHRPWKPGTNLGVDLGWIGGSSLSCWIRVESVTTPKDGTILSRTIRSIDAYTASVDHHRFVYRGYRYAGHNFLVPSDPGPGRLRLSLAQVVFETDRGHKHGGTIWLPQLVYIEVPREQFEQVDSCDFQGTTGRCWDLYLWLFDEWRWILEAQRSRPLWQRRLFPGP